MKVDVFAWSLAGLAPLLAALVAPAAAEVPGRCEHEVAGSVSRRVGNFVGGPSRLEGVPRVPIRLLDGAGEVVAETRTDATGRYSLERTCRGRYVVCPGTPCPAADPASSRYDPPSIDIVLPGSPKKTVNFRLLEPPQKEPFHSRGQSFVDIDDGVRESRDMKLAGAVRDYVQQALICPDEAACRLRVSVSNGHVSLRGTVPAAQRPRLERVAQAVRGVHSLDLTGVADKRLERGEPRPGPRPTPSPLDKPRPHPQERVLVVKPNSGATGTTLVIRGGPFGPRRGELGVVLAEAPTGSSTKPRQVELQILQWGAHEVRARIPELPWREGGRFAIVLVDRRQGAPLARSSADFTLDAQHSGTAGKGDPSSSGPNRGEPRPGRQAGSKAEPLPRPWPGEKSSPTDKPRPPDERDQPGLGGGSETLGRRPEGGPGLDPRDSPGGAGRAADPQGSLGRSARPEREVFPPDDRGIRHWQRTALVLQGGGALGAFQVGALKNLYARGLDPQIITGTSVGALNAAKLAEGRGVAGAADLERLWLSLRGNESIYVANPKFDRVGADTVDAWKSWATELGASVLTGLPGFLPGALYDGPSLEGSMEELLSDVDAIESLKLQSPLRSQVAKHIDPACVAASGIKLRLAAVAREPGDVRFFTESGDIETEDGTRIRGGRGDGPAVGSTDGSLLAPNLADGVLASSAIPLFFEPRITQGGEYYWDGAVKESTPIRKALDLGATNVVVVLTGPAPWRHQPSLRPGAYGLVIETVNQIADVEGVSGRAGDFRASVRINNQRSSWVTSRRRENDRNISPHWAFFPVIGDVEIRIEDMEGSPDHCDVSPQPGKNLRLFIDHDGNVSGDVQGHAGDLLSARGNGDGDDVRIQFRIVALSAGNAAYLGGKEILSLTPVKRVMRLLGQMTDELARGDMAVLDTLDTLGEVAAEVGEANVIRGLRSFPLPRGIDGRPYFLPRYDVIDAPLVLGTITDFDPDNIRLNLRIGELAAKYTRVDFLDRREALRGPQQSRYPEDGDYIHPTQNPAISDERLEQRKRADILELLQAEIDGLAARDHTQYRRESLQRELNELSRSRIVPSRHSPRLGPEFQDSLAVPLPRRNECAHDPCPALLQRVRALEASIERLQQRLRSAGAGKAQILDRIEEEQRRLEAARDDYGRQCGRTR